jgi:hypothetical protein
MVSCERCVYLKTMVSIMLDLFLNSGGRLLGAEYHFSPKPKVSLVQVH